MSRIEQRINKDEQKQTKELGGMMSQEKELNTNQEVATANVSELTSVSSALGEPESAEDLIDQLAVSGDQGLKKALVSMSNNPDHVSKVNRLIMYMADSTMCLTTGTTWYPRKINLIKKMNSDSPDFRVGDFKIDGVSKPQPEVLFLPLVYYVNNVYWPKYDPTVTEKKPSICNAPGGVFGLFKSENSYVKECDGCPFKEWGAQPDGSIVKAKKGEYLKPLCSPSHTFIGITPELDGIYEYTAKSYCTNKNYNAHQKLRTVGRLLAKINLDIPDISPELLKKFNIMQARIDIHSQWVTLAGESIKKGKETVSAGTIVRSSGRELTESECAFALILKRFAVNYITTFVDSFYAYVQRTVSNSVIDTEAVPSDAGSSAEANQEEKQSKGKGFEYTPIEDEEV